MMIEINLLPQELKARAKRQAPFELKGPLPAIPLVLALAIILLPHVFLFGAGVYKNGQLRGLNNKWRQLEPKLSEWEVFKKENFALTAQASVMEGLISNRVNWSEKLNRLSLNLPPGIWFKEASVDSAQFILKASVVALENQEMNLINKFINNLKNDAGFFGNFASLELSSVERDTIAGYDVVDFTLIAKLK